MSATKTERVALRERSVSDDGNPARNETSRIKTFSIIAAIISLIGLIDAIYLTAQHFAGMDVKCFAVAGCADVLGSDYATIFGLPVSVFGAFAYFVAFSLATLAAFGYKQARQVLTILVAAMFLMTVWLFYVQAFILHKFCSYCLLSAAVTVTLAALVLFTRRVARR
ncbi:MAG: hypothetical protein NVSMB56_03330 [Pyrinomonadaceae bacterium]